jgi:hypothetical protein
MSDSANKSRTHQRCTTNNNTAVITAGASSTQNATTISHASTSDAALGF